jgi:DNA-binding response OmpR family regulator
VTWARRSSAISANRVIPSRGTDGDGVDELVRFEEFDVVILDLTLPAGDGTAILRRLRRQRKTCPSLLRQRRAEIDDKVSLLDLGADDYLVKPFDIRELDARLRAVIRRKAGQPSSQVSIGALVVDQGAQMRRSRDDCWSLASVSSACSRFLSPVPGGLSRGSD